MSDARKIIDFINIAEGLKRELRHSRLSDGRQESVAEHTWSAMLLAMLLINKVEKKIDLLKVLKMLVVHDLPEVYGGDMPTFITLNGNQAKKDEMEKVAKAKLIKELPTSQLALEFSELWEEMEAKQTIESKLAHACDKANVILQHNNSDIKFFEQGDYDLNPYYRDYLFEFDNFIKEFKDQINFDTMNKFEKEGDMSRISPEHNKKWAEQKASYNIN